MHYGRKYRVNGEICGIINRGPYQEGCYSFVFETCFVDLNTLEQMDWKNPVVEVIDSTRENPLPAGYDFELVGITYEHNVHAYTVTIKTAAQCYGDVSAYQAEIETLNADKTALQQEKNAISNDLADADALVLELYEQINTLETGGAEQDVAPEEEQVEAPEMEV